MRRDPNAPIRLMGSRTLGDQLAELREKRRQAVEEAEQSATPSLARPYGDPSLIAQRDQMRKAYARRTKKA